MGLTAAPIKLSVGEQNEATSDGYGLVHIEANHGKDILNAGFKSVEDFVSYVAKNFDPDNIRVGKKRKNGSPTYLILVTDAKHDNTLYIELSQDGAYWNVNSGGIFRKGYSNKRETVAKTEPQQPNNAVSSDSSLSADKQSGISSTEPNGESPVSDRKLTLCRQNSKHRTGKVRRKPLTISADNKNAQDVYGNQLTDKDAEEYNNFVLEQDMACRDAVDAEAEEIGDTRHGHSNTGKGTSHLQRCRTSGCSAR
jgi:hypothetical protein